MVVVLVSAAFEWAVWFAQLEPAYSVLIYTGEHPHARTQRCWTRGLWLQQASHGTGAFCSTIHTHTHTWVCVLRCSDLGQAGHDSTYAWQRQFGHLPIYEASMPYLGAMWPPYYPFLEEIAILQVIARTLGSGSLGISQFASI